MPEPDLGFIVASRIPTEDDGYLPYPDLAVEVWSRSSDLADANKLKKARQKLQMYLKAGTQIAWGINLVTQEIEVYYQDGAKKILGWDDELDGEDIIPGFKMEIKALFK